MYPPKMKVCSLICGVECQTHGTPICTSKINTVVSTDRSFPPPKIEVGSYWHLFQVSNDAFFRTQCPPVVLVERIPPPPKV